MSFEAETGGEPTDAPGTLLAVAPFRHLCGIYRPGYDRGPKHGPQTYDWRAAPSSPDNTARVGAHYRLRPLAQALTHRYDTDAHMVSYVVYGPDGSPVRHPDGRDGYWQPRVNKDGLRWLREQGYDVRMGCFVADVDTPGHVPWTPDLLDQAREQIARSASLKTCGIYYTRKGWHIVQPLARPLPVEQGEAAIRRWLLRLEMEGLPVDHGCRDWTRLMRCPRVVRPEGRWDVVPDLEHMRPIDVTPPSVPPGSNASDAPRVRRFEGAIEFSRELPGHWDDKAKAIAWAVREGPQQHLHDGYLALTGALLDRHAPPEWVPEIVSRVCLYANSLHPDVNLQGAQRTVMKWAEGARVTSTGELRKGWPHVAEALLGATATGDEARIRAELAGVAPVAKVSAQLAASQIELSLLHASDGVTGIWVDCGAGKTEGAWRVAVTRAATHPRREGSSRAPANSKTVISFDKNSLALQTAKRIRDAGGECRRLFGAASYRDGEDLACKYPDQARALANGGQSVQAVLCDGNGRSPCQYRETCAAYKGAEGDEDAPVVLANHGLIRAAEAACGRTGLMVIDEPPSWLVTEAFLPASFDRTEGRMTAFAKRFRTAMLPALQAVAAFAREVGAEGQGYLLPQCVAAAADAIDPEALHEACLAAGVEPSDDAAYDAIRCVQGAFPADKPGFAPPLTLQQVDQIRKITGYAGVVAEASRVLHALYHGLSTPARVVVRVEFRGGERCVLITRPREDLEAVLRREGSVVVMDANFEVHAPVLKQILGYEPHVRRVATFDALPVQRVLLKSASANRSGWFFEGQPVWKSGIARGVQQAVEFAQEKHCATLCLISFKVVRVALEHVLGLAPRSQILADWKQLGRRPSELQEAEKHLRPVVEAWKGAWVLGHYGGLRGMNSAMHADCFVTLGDPWPNLGDVQADAAYLGVDWEVRAMQLARAELEQAMGRARTPHRTTPCRCMHIGSVVPGGHAWNDDVEVRIVGSGRPKSKISATGEELKEILDSRRISVKALATELGVARQVVMRYIDGTKRISSATWERIKDAIHVLSGSRESHDAHL